MKQRLVPVLALIFMAGSLPAHAQNFPNPECWAARYEHPRCYCIPVNESNIMGHLTCHEHNPCWECYGPGWCETYGSCSALTGTGDVRRAFAMEQDSITILDFLVELEKMTEEQRAAFVAEVDEQVRDGRTECEIEARHDAYRAKFLELMGVELRPGYIPVPPSRTKNPMPRITASME